MKIALGKIFKSKGLRQSFSITAGNMIGTSIAALAIILIIRILGPEKYAEFSVGFAIVLMLVRINDLGLNQSIIKFGAGTKKNSNKNFIYSYVLKRKLIISAIIFLIGLFFYETIADMLGIAEPLIIFLSFSFGLATVYYEYLLAVLQSLHLFTKTIFMNITQASIKLIAAGILFLIGATDVTRPYFWYIFATFIPVMFYKNILPKWFKVNFSLKDSVIRKKIITLAGHASIGMLAAGIIENIDILFVQRNLTAYETGLYGGVSRIALFFAIAAYSVSSVLNARVTRYRSSEHLMSFFKKSFALSTIVLVSFIFFIPLAGPLIFYSIGPEYLSGKIILIILSASSFLTLAAIPFIATFFALDADWYFSVSGILQLIIVLVGNFVFVPQYGLMGAAWTRFATRLFLLLFTVTIALITYRRQYGQHNKISA